MTSHPTNAKAANAMAPSLDRRSFLRGLGVSLAALTSGAGAGVGRLIARPLPLESFGGQCPRFGVFDDATFALLEAVAAQIVPPDEDPGATEFCSASLVEAISAGDPTTAGLLIRGLHALDEASRVAQGPGFVDLPFALQTLLLQAVEAGQAPGDLWDEILPATGAPAGESALLETLGWQRIARTLDGFLPAKHRLGGLAASAELGAAAQRAVFATLRTLCKLAFVLNFPETTVRQPDGMPIFSDPEHLISDPDDDTTATGWTVVAYHEIDYEVEQLMWEWQAGFRVVGFDGVPILDTASPLSEAERLTARDTLYAMSDRGLA